MLTEEGKKKRAVQDAEIEARVAAFKVEQRDLLGELAAAGVHIDMVNRLPNIPTDQYVHTLPILFKHMRKQYSEGTLASLARALATKEAGQYWDDLVDMYRGASVSAHPESGSGSLAMALAVAVSASCPAGRIGELVELLRDQELLNRALLLAPLRRKRGRDPSIALVLEELRRDPELSREINSWKVLPSQQIPGIH